MSHNLTTEIENREPVLVMMDTESDGTVTDPIRSIGVLLTEKVAEESDFPNSEDAQVSLTFTTEDSSEEEMIQKFGDFLSELSAADIYLAGYGNEMWRDGEFSKLRTRCIRLDIPWVLSGYIYADFGEAIKNKGRFNTKTPSMKDAYVSEIDAFIDYFELDIDKSLNKRPKLTAVEDFGYTAEMVEEFAEKTDMDVQFSSQTEVSDVYRALTGKSPDESSLNNLLQVHYIYTKAQEYVNYSDWHITRL